MSWRRVDDERGLAGKVSTPRETCGMMPAMRRSVATAVLSISCVFGHAQDVANPTDSNLDTIRVEASRAALRKEISSFVSAVTRLDGELISRWSKDTPICPLVIADNPAIGEFIRKRLLEIAAQVPIRAETDPKCLANLFVIVSEQAPEFAAKWEKGANWEKLDDGNPRPGRARWKPRPGATRSAESLPVRTWHNMRIEQSDGAPMLSVSLTPGIREARSAKDLGSRITSNVAENLTGVVVLVDTRAAAGVTVTQLADYIAMTSFAKPDLEADLANTDSILQLFAVEPANRPPGLTEWDHAFLRGLYRISFTPKHQRMSIATRMVGELAPR